MSAEMPPLEDDPRSHRERMLVGDLYIADDPALEEESHRAMRLTAEYNASPPADQRRRHQILTQLFGSIGDGTVIRPPLFCDYGYQIHIGARAMANFGLVILDVARVTIGDDVQIGPGVQILTPTHPLAAQLRRAKWEAAKPISIGNNVWLGGGSIVCPGVTIGDNTVVGAGSVVTRDLASGVMAVGSPARVVRAIE